MSKKMRLFLCLGSYVTVAAGLSGCGIGIIAAIVAGSSGSDNVVEVVPTTVIPVTPSDGQTGQVPFKVAVQANEGDDVRLTSLEFSLFPGMEFEPATRISDFPSVQLGANDRWPDVSGRALSLIWNSSRDLDRLAVDPPASARTVLRVTYRNETRNEEVTVETDEFFVSDALVSTVAGGGVGDGDVPLNSTLLNANSIDKDSRGDLYVADTGNHRIRKVSLLSLGAREIVTVAGNGFQGAVGGINRATGTSLSSPSAVAVASDDRLFILESLAIGGQSASFVRVVDQQVDLITTFIQPGQLLVPTDLAIDASDFLYVTDRGRGQLRKYDTVNGSFSLVGDGIVMAPFAVGIHRESGERDAVYVADLTPEPVIHQFLVRRLLDTQHEVVAGGGTRKPREERIPLDGSVPGTDIQLTDPRGIAANGTHLFISDRTARYVLVLETGGFTVVNIIIDDDDGALDDPSDAAVDATGQLFVLESGKTDVDAAGALAAKNRVIRYSRPQEPEEEVLALVGRNSIKSRASGIPGSDVRQLLNRYSQNPGGTG